MLYAIIGDDNANSQASRQKARPEHLQRLQQLHDQGRLIIAGPCPAVDSLDQPELGFTGSVIIAEFSSLEAAQEWADADPYKSAGVYKSTQVRPFKQVFPS